MNGKAITCGLACVMLLMACRDDAGGSTPAAGPATSNAPQQQPAVQPASRPAPVAQPDAGGAQGTRADAAGALLSMSRTPSSHVVDAAGMAIYVLQGNDDGSKCDAACEEAWPPVLATDQRPMPGQGVDQGKLGARPRPDGSAHVTYGGKPVYRYAADGGAGRTNGHGVQDQWGKWHLVGLDGTPLPDDATK